MTKDDTVLTMYLREINKIPLLTREEENELALKAKNGDPVAKNKIVNANLRFVITVAKKYQNHGLDLTDLISEGNLGLLTAIEKFDTTKGYHFISYAVWWIRQSILKAICEKSRMIRLPLNRANELVQIEKAKKTISSNMSEEEEIREIAGMLNMTENHVRDMINIARDMVSLDSAVRPNDSESSSVGEFIEDSMYTRPEDEAINKSMKEDISKVLATLTDKEAEVLRYRFGLEGYKSMSLKEVGDVFNLTKERIRQIEKKAIKRLQHPTRAKRLASYIA
ncbi:MAG: RNA polymerase sigma factor RpoD/SigA [Spirochaetaceae bacterium]|nr:RNA polymerase sigma factor RpoD/SigA [Spirochaetaceae bacterium]MBQ4554320.1 RNA polymerase sigma factor RpoD/SigA [Spirochaetaceae bacterium]